MGAINLIDQISDLIYKIDETKTSEELIRLMKKISTISYEKSSLIPENEDIFDEVLRYHLISLSLNKMIKHINKSPDLFILKGLLDIIQENLIIWTKRAKLSEIKILTKKKLHQRILDLYDKLLEIDPTYIDAHYAKGLTHSSLKKYNEALEEYNKVLEIYPTYLDAYYGKGVALSALGKKEEAIVETIKPYK